MSRGVGRIVSKAYKMVPDRTGKKHRRYVGFDAKGRWKFLKTPGKSKTKSSSKTKTKSKRKNPVTKKNKRRRSREITIPIAIVAPIAGTLAWCYQAHGEWAGRLNLLCASYTGYDPGLQKFRPGLLKQGLGSLIIGAIIHKFVGGSPLNVNRMLARAKVPFIRI